MPQERIGREKEVTEEIIVQEKLLCPEAGTATSSPANKTASQSNMNIVNIMLCIKRNAYADSIIKATAKRLNNAKLLNQLHIL